MANIASIDYRIDGEPKQLAELYEVIETAKMLDSKAFDGYTVLQLLGVEGIDDMDLRFDINDFDFEDDHINLTCEGKWSEKENFRHELEMVFPEINIFFYCEEPGCEIYMSNDVTHRYFYDNYIVDICDCGEEYFEHLEDAVRYVERNLEITIESTSSSGVKRELEEYSETHEKYAYLRVIDYDSTF